MAVFRSPASGRIKDFPIEIDIKPFMLNADLIKTSTFRLAKQLGDMSDPLKISVKNVVIPSMIRNFAVGGRPPWPLLAESTLLYRANREARMPRPLIRTEFLARNATSFPIWRVTKTEADMDALDRIVPYGKFHQLGTRLMPQRQFALLQLKDIEDIVVVFDSWIRITLSKKDMWPYDTKEF